MGCVMAAFSRTEQHNNVVLAYLVMVSVMGVVSLMTQGWFAHALKGVVEKTVKFENGASASPHPHSDLETIIAKLDKFKRSLFVTGVLLGTLNMTMFAVYLGLGRYLPYAWVIWPFQGLNSLSYLYTCLVFLRKEHGSSSLPGESNNALGSGPGSSRDIAANSVIIPNSPRDGAAIVASSSANE
jgi:hypothetical protein